MCEQEGLMHSQLASSPSCQLQCEGRDVPYLQSLESLYQLLSFVIDCIQACLVLHLATVETGLLAHALMGSIAESMRLYSRMRL